jgi:hypothetical protein
LFIHPGENYQQTEGYEDVVRQFGRRTIDDFFDSDDSAPV